MNASILRKVVMLGILLAGYLSVTGACCQECCGQDDYTTRCNSDTGYCLQGNCIDGSPEPGANKCAGKSEGEVCAVTDEITGTCVEISDVLRCLVVVEMPSP